MAENEYEKLGDVFARNVKFRRTQRNMTQTEVARLMKERGFSFHQQTVQRIEDGVRPVKLEEAYALSRIFEISVDSMAWNMENMRAHDISELAHGALSVLDGITRGIEEWYDKAAMFVSQLNYQLENDGNKDRFAAGTCLIHRMTEWSRKSSEFRQGLGEDFFDDIFKRFGGADDDSDDSPSEDDDFAVVDDFVGQHEADPALARLTVDELAEIYIRPDGEAANELLARARRH